MGIILFIILSILFFPAIIFLDYHKKKNVHRAIWFLVFFVIGMLMISLTVQIFKFSVVYFLPLFPFALIGILFLKKKV